MDQEYNVQPLKDAIMHQDIQPLLTILTQQDLHFVNLEWSNT